MGSKARHLTYPGRQGSGEYRRRSGPPEELSGSIDRELRVYTGLVSPIEIRADEGGDPNVRSVVGHAAVFDRLSEELGMPGLSFRERIRRGAFRRVLDDGPDTAFLIDHDPRLIMARTTSGTLELSEDPRGLRAFSRVDVRQSYTSDLVVAMERRDVTQMSFGFRAGEDEWLERHHDDGTVEIVRDIVEVSSLFDVSAVTFPAYPQTDVGLRAAVTVCGSEILAPDGGVYVDELRELARRIHAGEIEATLEERAAIDAVYLQTDGVSPWVLERALRAVAREPERAGEAHEGEADPVTEDPGAGDEHRLVAARRARLDSLSSF